MPSCLPHMIVMKEPRSGTMVREDKNDPEKGSWRYGEPCSRVCYYVPQSHLLQTNLRDRASIQGRMSSGSMLTLNLLAASPIGQARYLFWSGELRWRDQWKSSETMLDLFLLCLALRLLAMRRSERREDMAATAAAADAAAGGEE
jgi:hypothetical protein